MGETLDKDDPMTAAEMDKLKVSAETKEDVLKMMSAISDNRVVRLANDVEDALHDAATYSLSREAFKISLAKKLESKMDDMQELREEYYPHIGAGDEITEGKGSFQAVLDSLEDTEMMKAFDAWKSKEEKQIAQERKQIIKDTKQDAEKDVKTVTEEERAAQ